MDQQLENKVKFCEECQLSRNLPPKVPLHPWEWPERPWSRIHVDYAGPFLGKWFLIVIDAHSKWIEVAIVTSATSTNTIEKLRAIFAIHGLPEVIVSDNGTVFTSTEFQEFVKRNDIKHIRTAPYHPSSNGQAERVVQIFKESMGKTSLESWKLGCQDYYLIIVSRLTRRQASLLLKCSWVGNFDLLSVSLFPIQQPRLISNSVSRRKGMTRQQKRKNRQLAAPFSYVLLQTITLGQRVY